MKMLVLIDPRIFLLFVAQATAFTLTQCETTTDCPCFGQANGTTGSLVPSDVPALTITCGFTALGIANGAKCMGGKCLCAPGWWGVDVNTNGNVYAECGYNVANASIPGGSNLYSPIHTNVSYYWNQYMPQYCACNDFMSFTANNIQGQQDPVCAGGNVCFPGCTAFWGCFNTGSASAAVAIISNCATFSSHPTCNNNQLPASTLSGLAVIHPAVQQDPAYYLASDCGVSGVNCVVSNAHSAELGQSPPFCYCKPGFCSQNCCPCNTATNITCGGIGECMLTGACNCPAGTNGTYCCPIGNNGTVCGPYGTCMPDGTCLCTRDFLGSACQNIDTRCPTNTPSFSCSGIGTCVQQASFDDCLATLNYIDNPAIQLSQFSPPITDEGIWNLVVDLWLAFKLTDISASTDRSLFAPYLTCNGTANEAACVLNRWVANYNNTDASIDAGGFRRNIAGYILDAFAAFHPELAGISGGFLAALIPLINATYHNPTSLYQGEAALLCYPQYINWLDVSLTATFPTYPLSNCHCTDVTTGTVGATMLPAGPDCASSCPLGNNGVVCSGYFEGQFEGVCSPSPGADVCICDPRFAGAACQFDLIGECYPQFSSNVQACTASSHGTCYLTNPLAQNQVYACNCSDTWRGTYCEFSRCAPGGHDDTVECSGNGICEPTLMCSCDIARFLGGCRSSSIPALTTCTGVQTCLPIGSQCEQNGIAQCGVFTPDSGSCSAGQGFWTSCSGHGTCTPRTDPLLPYCNCDAGFNGTHCEQELCIPGCNSHSTCNTNTGQCFCQTMWSSPGGCTNSSLSCFCSQNLCVHGEPNTDGSSCDCDSGWSKDGSGHCTVVQCPFIVETNQGEIPCLPATPFCPSTNGLVPQNQQFSLDNGCCINTCPTCQLNTTTGVRTCLCINNIQYTQIGGICFSVCHGQPSSIVGQSVVCDCSHVTIQPNQFINSFCELFTCLNGGTPDGSGGCTCTAAFTGQFCAAPNCGNNGLPNVNNTACDCFPPYIHSPPSSPLCLGDTCGAGGTVTVIGPQQFQCSCASNMLIGPLSLSCIALNCSLPSQQGSCALCMHGSVPYITANALACNCSGTGYSGIQCSILQCLNSGTVQTVNNQQSCLCSFPWTGSVCQTSLCLNGGQAGNGVCNCVGSFTGNVCQNASVSSTGHSSSSSSSSLSSTASKSSSSSSSSSTAGHKSSSSSGGSSSTGTKSSSSSTGTRPSSSSTGPSSTGTSDNTVSSSTADNSTSSNSSSSSSSTAVATQSPSTATGLTPAEWYGAVVGGTVGGAILIAGILTIVAWQLGWGAFGTATAAATAAAASASASASAAIEPAAAATAATVAGRARIREEERFPLLNVRRLP